MTSVERYFNWPPKTKVESTSSTQLNLHGEKDKVDVVYLKKLLYTIGPLRLLGKAGRVIRISSLINGKVVRTIEFLGNGKVKLDPMTGNPSDILLLDDLTEVLYEPWDMDRGSLLFRNTGGEQAGLGAMLKLATEGDPVTVVEQRANSDIRETPSKTKMAMKESEVKARW